MKDFVKKVSQKLSKLSQEQLENLIVSINNENDVLDSIMESLSSGLVIVDDDYKIIQTNKAAERLLPFRIRPLSSDSKSESASPVWELLDDSALSFFLQDCYNEKKTNVSEDFSFEKEAGVRFVTISILPLVQQKLISGYIITVDDITEKRQQEILLHRMESLASLTNLAASVAHEIKNPLGAISIHIQLLQKAVKKAREGDCQLPKRKFMEDYLDVVNEEIANLNKIVVDFLFAVRPVQAQLVLADPDAIVKKTSTFFAPEFESKSVRLAVSLCNCKQRLMIDEKLFREALINIIQNALAAISTRYEITDRSLSYEGELILESFIKNEKYILTIADNGCGMDEKTVSHIFEPYYTTKATGTGLGLTTVYKIIKEFRGDIDVKSVPGHGSVFTVTLPLPQKSVKLLAQNPCSKSE